MGNMELILTETWTSCGHSRMDRATVHARVIIMAKERKASLKRKPWRITPGTCFPKINARKIQRDRRTNHLEKMLLACSECSYLSCESNSICLLFSNNNYCTDIRKNTVSISTLLGVMSIIHGVTRTRRAQTTRRCKLLVGK